MNLRIARAFWFAHFTRTWPFVFGGLLLGAAVPHIFDAMNDTSISSSDVHNIFAVVLYLVVPVQLIGLLYNASFTNSFSCGLPESTLLLPASSFAIALHRFVFNLTVVGTSVFLLHTLMRLIFPYDLSPWWEWVGGAVGLCAFLQFVALATSPSGDWTIGFLIAAAVLYASLPTPGIDASALHPALRVVLSLPLTTVILSYLGLWATVYLMRQGRWSLPALASPQIEIAQPRDHELKPFKSAWHAQLWLETRTYWRPIFRIFLVLAGLYGALLWGMMRESEEGVTSIGPFRVEPGVLGLAQQVLSYSMLVAFAFGGVVASLQNRRWQIGPMASFLYTRPFTTSNFTSARIAAALRVWAVFSALIVMNFGPRLVEAWINDELQDADRMLSITYILFAFTGFWVALWTWNLLALLIPYVASLALAFTLALGDSFFADHLHTRIFPILVFASVLLALALAYRRNLLRSKLQWAFPIAVLLLINAWTYAALRTNEFPIEILYVSDLLPILCVYAFIIAPLATVPLAHHWCRHR